MSAPSSQPARISVDSFAIALWMYSQGHRPISAGSDPGTGRSRFIFPGKAQSAYESYNAAKAALNLLTGGR